MTHGVYTSVHQCMPHGSWGFVTMRRPWVMGKKSLKGLRGRHTLSNNVPGFVDVSIIAYDLGSDHECRVEETMGQGQTYPKQQHTRIC